MPETEAVNSPTSMEPVLHGLETFGGWPDVVARNIHDAVYDDAVPPVLIIDGLSPASLFLNANPDYRLLPNHIPKKRPSYLHKSGSVRLMNGDVTFDSLRATVLPYVSPTPEVADYTTQLYETYAINRASLRQTVLLTAIVGGTTLTLLGGDFIRNTIKDKQAEREATRYGRIAEQPLTRRHLLKGAGIVGLGTFVASTTPAALEQGVSALAAQTTGKTQDVLQAADRLIPKPFDTYTDGRTALLCAKRDFLRFHKPPLAGVAGAKMIELLGNGHNNKYEEYQDPNKRRQAIRLLAGLLITEGKKIYALNAKASPEQTPPEVTNNILDYLCQIDYLKVDDPGTDLTVKNITNHVTKIGPPLVCTEIFNATKDLRL